MPIHRKGLSIQVRAQASRTKLRNQIQARCPSLFLQADNQERNSIVLGRNHEGAPVAIPLRARLEHAQCIGTTGAGKTKFLEHCIRQDITEGRGVCVVDPHGNHPDSLYRSLLSWLEGRGLTKKRTIHLIDPNAASHVTGLNPLALPSCDYDFSVIAEAMQEALERIWGEEDMNTKPTMQRVLGALLTALTELNLTIAEARLLLDPHDRRGIRAWAIETLSASEAREELEWLDEIAKGPRGPHEFRLEITGPRNRLAKLTRNNSVRAMVGQKERTIDFRAALDEGHIILANLSPGPRASDKAMQLLGRLLTRMLFFHCERRNHPERPFFFYLDECQLFLSGDISRFLAESRKYGMGVVLSSQYLAQFELAGKDVLEAVKNATNLKVVFRVKDTEEAAALADLVVPYDLERPVNVLIKPTVVGHRIASLSSESQAEQFATTVMRAKAIGSTVTNTEGYSESVAKTNSESVSQSFSEGESGGHTVSDSFAFGTSTGTTTADSMTPALGLLSMPNIVGSSRAESTQDSAGQTQASSSTEGHSSVSTQSNASSQSTTHSSTISESVSRSKSVATSVGAGETQGRTTTRGTQQTFEPLYETRPSAVHSIENVRYSAAQAVRNLTSGNAVLSFVDSSGFVTAMLAVAKVKSHALPAIQFDELRTRVFDSSPSATPSVKAFSNLLEREEILIIGAESDQRAAEPHAPLHFRIKKTRPAPANEPRRPRGNNRQKIAGRYND